MTAEIVILSALVIICNGLSIGTVSENVNRSEPSIGDVFPDWVPFKNKHGDELGEFVPVVTKNKVKKRLALPTNFILKAVAEPDNDDYYEKGQGGDNEDSYDNKDWSDINRHAEPVDSSKLINHTEISDIEGVVNILTRQPANSIADAINSARKINVEEETESNDEEPKEEITTITPAPIIEEPQKNKQIEQQKVLKNEKNSEEEYDEESSEKEKAIAAKEASESEAKKARLLDAVDDLKLRHAEESRVLSEKMKEEELYKEEFAINNQPAIVRNKYGNRKKLNKVTPDYEEYDESNNSDEKYPGYKKPTTQSPKRTTSKENKHESSGKLSVFKNPQLYMIYDDSEEETTTPKAIRGKQKFSARYTSTPLPDSDDDRISLLPENAKEGEPALFFPKKRKNKRRKVKTTTPSDSFFAETVTEKLNVITAVDTTATDTSAADSKTDTTVDTAPTATDASASGSDISAAADIATTAEETGTTGTEEDIATVAITDVADAEPASSDHKKEEKSGDYHSDKGGGREHSSEHHEEHEEHGKKAYEGHHEDSKTAKGQHDKNNHLQKYDDHAGSDKHHSEEAGHYGSHHHEEHGKKHAKYEESGKHSKGHSTKGSHDVHKKEEYEKNVEFFEEEGDSAEEEKHGGWNHEKGHSEGGKFHKGKLDAAHKHNAKGESGHFAKGGHANFHKGHKLAAGHDSHGNHGDRNFHKGGKKSGGKWVYHHGYPAKTANLVVIDRREDQMFHGPRYYG